MKYVKKNGRFDKGENTFFFSDCPFCTHRLEFMEEQTKTVKECPVCSLPIRFEEFYQKDWFGEEKKYKIVGALSGESFAENGFVVENGTLVRYEDEKTVLQLPEKILSIGEGVFENHTETKEVILPKGLLHIGVGAFEGCLNLKKVQISDGLLTIGHGAFLGCKKLEKVKIPSSLRACGYAVFQDCENLEEADLPMDMAYVSDSPYRNCKKLKRANVPHYVNDFSRWFESCESLEVVTFGRGVDRIEYMKFPKLKEAYFFETEEWEKEGAHFPAEKLKDPKKAAQLLKKYAFERTSLYIPTKREPRSGLWRTYKLHNL